MAQLKDTLISGLLRVTGNIFGNLNGTVNGKEVASADQGIHQVIGTQTESTSDWTGILDLDALTDGLTIAYYLPYISTSTAATLNLTLSGGTSTGPIEVYTTGVTRATTHYAAGSTILLTYWSAGSVAIDGTLITTNRWTRADYNTNTNTIGEYGGAIVAGSVGLPRYALAMQISPGVWEGVVTTSSTGTKTRNTNGFMTSSPIVYVSTATYDSGETAPYTGVWTNSHSINTRYSANVNSSWSVAGRPFFLVGQITDDKFYLSTSPWWADAYPTTADGKYYWYVGQLQSAYQITLHPTHPIYYYNNGLKIYYPGMV